MIKNANSLQPLFNPSPELFTPIDDKGCIAAAYSFALANIGIELAVQTIENQFKRKPNELPSRECVVDFELSLLDMGVSMRVVRLPYTPDMRKYFVEGSTLTHDDFLEEMHYAYDGFYDEHFKTTYTKAEFDIDMANRRRLDSGYQLHRQSGRYIVEEAEIDVDLIEKLVSTGPLMVVDPGGSEFAHQRAIIKTSRTPKGDTELHYFNPNPEGSEVLTGTVPNGSNDFEGIFSPLCSIVALRHG